MTSEETRRFAETQKAYRENDPPIEVNQIWSAPDVFGKCLRRVRVMAIHPDTDKGKRLWITQDVPGGMMKTDFYRLQACPEFNLRYVFKLER
jgi:hypothetical protein